jgi:hypothetical protein
MKKLKAPLIAFLLVAGGAAMSCLHAAQVSLDGIVLDADTLRFDSVAGVLQAEGRVTLTVPETYTASVSNSEGQRAWHFLPGGFVTIRADRARIHWAARSPGKTEI